MPPSREEQGEQLSLRLGLFDSADAQHRTDYLAYACLCLCMQQASETALQGALCLDKFPLKASMLNSLIPRVALLEGIWPLGDGLVTGSSNHEPELP